MESICFYSALEFEYHWCGKFIAPNDEWIHLTRELTDYELIVMTEGTLFIEDATHKYTVCEGDCLLMTPTLSQRGFKSSDCSFYWMHFSYNNGNNNHLIDADTDIAIRRLFKLRSPERLIIMLKELQDSDRRSKNAVLNRYLCSAILAEASVQAADDGPKSHELRKSQVYADICDYISWHISEPLRIGQIAEYFGYNEKYLTTFFRMRSGIPLKQYIIKAKMERAKMLLTEGSANISEIAFGLGFDDVHNFSNAFKVSVGMSPMNYRETYTKHNINQA